MWRRGSLGASVLKLDKVQGLQISRVSVIDRDPAVVLIDSALQLVGGEESRYI